MSAEPNATASPRLAGAPGGSWKVLYEDSESGAEFVAAPESDRSAFPFDGRPEHGRFKNARGVSLHFYVWYPPCGSGVERTPSAASAPSASSAEAGCAARRCCCCCCWVSELPKESSPRGSRLEAAEASACGACRGCTLLAQPSECPVGEVLPSAVSGGRAAPALCSGGSGCRRPSSSGAACQGCLQCRAESAACSKGAVILLHGFTSHARYSWLRRSKAPLSPTPGEERGCRLCEGSPQYAGSFVAALNRLGFVVFALDCEGHGLSDGWRGKRGAFYSLDGVAENCLQLLWIARRRLAFLKRLHARAGGAEESLRGVWKEAEKKGRLAHQAFAGDSLFGDEEAAIFLCGSSLGGWAAARCAQKLRDPHALERAIPLLGSLSLEQLKRLAARGGDSEAFGAAPDSDSKGEDREQLLLRATASFARVAGVVLSSPMFDVSTARKAAFFPAIAPLLKFLSLVAPHFVVSQPVQDTRYPLEAEQQLRDPLVLRQGTQANVAFEILSESDRPLQPREIGRLSDESCGALLLLHNALDDMCRITGSLRFFKAAAMADKTFWVVNGVRPATGGEVAPARKEDLPQNQLGSPRDALPSFLHSALIAELEPFVDESLCGLDVFHSFASEPDGFALLERICDWLSCRAKPSRL